MCGLFPLLVRLRLDEHLFHWHRLALPLTDHRSERRVRLLCWAYYTLALPLPVALLDGGATQITSFVPNLIVPTGTIEIPNSGSVEPLEPARVMYLFACPFPPESWTSALAEGWGGGNRRAEGGIFFSATIEVE
jgi:hypothetical protein